MNFDIIEGWLNALDDYFRTPEGPGMVAAGIVFFWVGLFFVIGLIRGHLWPKRRNGVFYVSDWLGQLAAVEMVPLIFMGLGLVPFLPAVGCIGNPEGNLGFDCGGPRDDCATCAGITVYDAARQIRWIPSLMNAYATGVISFQPLVGIVIVVLLALLILWLTWKLMMVPVRYGVMPIARFVGHHAKKIPIRP